MLRIGVEIVGAVGELNQFIAPNTIVKRSVWWNEVEAIKGQYNWADDENIAKLSGFDLYLSIKNSPVWARTVPNKECSRPKWIYWNNYITLCQKVIQRYRPKYIEIWNEPDCMPEQVPIELAHWMGCWSNTFDGGKQYGRFVNKVYSTIKPKHPFVTIVAGAFIQPSVFSQGMLRTAKYDWVSFHAYTNPLIPDPTLIERNAQQLIDQGYTCPLFCSETSYLSDPEGITQANYFNYLTSANLSAKHIVGFSWYTLNDVGWEHCEMIDRYAGADHPRPVWNEYNRYMTSRLEW